jgi:hypothetical protein
MMEAARSSETLVNFYQTSRRYNPEDSHLLLKFCLNSPDTPQDRMEWLTCLILIFMHREAVMLHRFFSSVNYGIFLMAVTKPIDFMLYFLIFVRELFNRLCSPFTVSSVFYLHIGAASPV